MRRKSNKLIMENQRRFLISAGVLLFILALGIGLVMPWLANIRMGLSAHLVGILGGLFLIAIGAIWPLQNLPMKWGTAAARLGVFSSYLNLCATFFAAAFSTNRLTPLAGSGRLADAWKENIVTGGLVLSSLAMVSCCILLLWGLRRAKAAATAGPPNQPFIKAS